MKADYRFYQKRDAWKKSFFFGDKHEKNLQYRDKNSKKDPYYNPYVGPITDQVLIDHFYSPPVDVGRRFQGSLAFKPVFNDNLLWVCFDLDDDERVKKAEAGLLPRLKSLGIDYMEELGGDKLERRHIWIRVESKQSIAKDFFTRLLIDIYQYKDFNEPFSSTEFDEVFGVNKPTNVVRAPLGFHLKRNKRFPIVLKDGNLSTDPAEFMDEWLGMNVLTEVMMAGIIGTLSTPPVAPVPKSNRACLSSETFLYTPRGLKLPTSVPTMLLPVVKNCQAINSVIEDVMTSGMIQKRGGTHDKAGLFLAGIAAYSDAITSKRMKRKIVEGENWFKNLVSNFRLRDDSSHNWNTSMGKAKTNPGRVFASCQQWEEKFNKCHGCPFKDTITTPQIFTWGKPAERRLFKPVKLTTADNIRLTTFVTVKKYVEDLVQNKMAENVLLASPQGSGKSFLVDEIACSLKKMGKTVLIAVPTTDLAIEHKDRLKACGVDSFILSSHENIFKKKMCKFDCPDFDPIHQLIKLGVSATSIKEQYCANCPYLNACYYPRQYSEVLEPQHRIVIMQHAHFGTPEIVWDLMKKNFDALFIDESFIEQCYSHIPLNPMETNLLAGLTPSFPWAGTLSKWLSGVNPKPTSGVNPDESDLEDVRKVLLKAGIEWRVPDLIRLHNQKREVNPDIGIEVIYELPNIPVRVFTDATPPEELIKRMTGIDNLTVFGRGEVLDPRKIHPDNKVIQLLDNSTSVSAMSDPERFENMMMKIAELAELVYTNHKILLTVYKKDISRVGEFFQNHKAEFPNAQSRITVDFMNKGTNKYEDYDIQFLMAGVYFTANQIKEKSYKYKTVSNYYLSRRGMNTIQNIKPNFVGSGAGRVEREEYPITRIESDKTTGGVYQYPSIIFNRPVDEWHQYVDGINTSTTQQAIRIRFKPDKPRIVYILNNMFLPSMLITESQTYNEFISPV